MKLHQAETVNKLNAQHRTLNIDDATIYRFSNKQTAESSRRTSFEE